MHPDRALLHFRVDAPYPVQQGVGGKYMWGLTIRNAISLSSRWLREQLIPPAFSRQAFLSRVRSAKWISSALRALPRRARAFSRASSSSREKGLVR